MQNLILNVINSKKIKEIVINFISKNKILILTLLVAIIYLSLYFLVDFSTQSLVAHDEGLYARRARLIESTDNWFSPPFPSPHHKTLGSYWFSALSIRLFGNSEFSLRLPSIISSCICLISSYLISLKITNRKSALISVFALSSMPLWIQYSRYASPDFPFVLCILLTILFFLKAIESSRNIRQYFYIFFSGLFMSTSFFIRSYMAVVPLIGLAPFIFCHLFRKDYFFKIYFFSGIFLGFIPTYLNLYYSIKKFGIIGSSNLFEFAMKQAVGEVGFKNLLLVPLNFIYLTFPIGILLLLLLVFTTSNIKTNYPLLLYCYPLISLSLLLCMSTSYPHYYLFLLPSLSIIFSTFLTSNSFRYSFSRATVSYILFIILFFLSFAFIFFIFNYKDLVIKISYGNPLIVYVVTFVLLLSYLKSIRVLFDINDRRYNLITFFYNIIIPQYISLSLLYNFGIMGNPNYKTKLFLKDDSVLSIIKSNTIYLFSVDSKMQTLLSYYLPSSKIVDNFQQISKHKYVITSNINYLEGFDAEELFVTVKKFDNHLLLMNISE